jgi:hypothetical protein
MDISPALAETRLYVGKMAAISSSKERVWRYERSLHGFDDVVKVI